ncbi:hypothetical protein GCM10027578_22210 [Spirosoma luteolum]
MAYTDSPKIGEYLWSTQDNTPVYREPKASAERVLSNYTNDQSMHPFRKGDQVGKLVEDAVVRGPEGEAYYKVEAWIWTRKAVPWWNSITGYQANQEFFTAYVRADHEPEWWIRESRKDSYQQAQQKSDTDQDVAGYISGLRGVPQPTEIRKRDDGSVWLTFANSYQVTFEDFKKLAADTVRTLTTENKKEPVVPPPGLKDGGNGNGSGNGAGSILTPTVVLIGAIGLSLFGLFIYLSRRRTWQR